MQRVLVIGSPGAGKSTLATQLAERSGLPLIHLDQQYWSSGWVEPAKAEWRDRVARLASAERWIMDGNYGGSLATRLNRADTVVWLDLPWWKCVARLVRRSLRNRGRGRSDMAEGCVERLDAEYLAFLWYTATFPLGPGKRIGDLLQGYSGNVIRLRSKGAVQRFLESPAGRDDG